jgi:hypothetical protein
MKQHTYDIYRLKGKSTRYQSRKYQTANSHCSKLRMKIGRDTLYANRGRRRTISYIIIPITPQTTLFSVTEYPLYKHGQLTHVLKSKASTIIPGRER